MLMPFTMLPVDIFNNPKEWDKNYAWVSPHNFWLVFIQEQLAAFFQATYLKFPILQASILFDLENLHNNILSALPSDPSAVHYLQTPRFSIVNQLWWFHLTRWLHLHAQIG